MDPPLASLCLCSSVEMYRSWCIIFLAKRSSGRSLELTPEIGTLFVFFTGGIVFLTLIVNGSTTQFVLHCLDMDKLTVAKKRILDFTKYEMLNKALEAFGELGDDEELGEF
ncbi:Sodium/hydrogen exchanger [Arachis hypogaea]|uniref:Sodium/hydrogen exchanger n=1 Tax=Arachis hypogaea TaxID=3818 RepID=A0A6B9V9S0_ARAHY|nr:Sodium/hydrogen exchanger [Arachis hypogaea]